MCKVPENFTSAFFFLVSSSVSLYIYSGEIRLSVPIHVIICRPCVHICLYAYCYIHIHMHIHEELFSKTR